MSCPVLFGTLLGVTIVEGLVCIILAIYLFSASGDVTKGRGGPTALKELMDGIDLVSSALVLPGVVLLITGILLLVRSILLLLALTIKKPYALAQETHTIFKKEPVEPPPPTEEEQPVSAEPEPAEGDEAWDSKAAREFFDERGRYRAPDEQPEAEAVEEEPAAEPTSAEGTESEKKPESSEEGGEQPQAAVVLDVPKSFESATGTSEASSATTDDDPLKQATSLKKPPFKAYAAPTTGTASTTGDQKTAPTSATSPGSHLQSVEMMSVEDMMSGQSGSGSTAPNILQTGTGSTPAAAGGVGSQAQPGSTKGGAGLGSRGQPGSQVTSNIGSQDQVPASQAAGSIGSQIEQPASVDSQVELMMSGTSGSAVQAKIAAPQQLHSEEPKAVPAAEQLQAQNQSGQPGYEEPPENVTLTMKFEPCHSKGGAAPRQFELSHSQPPSQTAQGTVKRNEKATITVAETTVEISPK